MRKLRLLKPFILLLLDFFYPRGRNGIPHDHPFKFFRFF